MANLGATVEVYENGSLATGYQVAMACSAKHVHGGYYIPAGSGGGVWVPYHYGPRPAVCQLQTTAGAAVNFDLGYAYYDGTGAPHRVDTFHDTALWVQPPDRDPMTLNAEGTAPKVLFPFFQSHYGAPQVPYIYALQTDYIVRFYFMKIQLKVRWESEDGGNPDKYLLKERWVGGGFQEWAGTYAVNWPLDWPLWGRPTVSGTRLRHQSWYLPGMDPVPDVLDLGQMHWPDWYRFYGGRVADIPGTPAFPYLPWGYTDEDGICTYRFLAAWAIGRPDPEGYGGYTWTLFRPGLSKDGNDQGEVQNIALFVSAHGRNAYKLAIPRADRPYYAPWGCYKVERWNETYPWLLMDSEDHAYRQRTFLDADDGQNWRVDYSTWDADTGTLTLPTPDLAIHTYTQGVRLQVQDVSGMPLSGATVSYGYAGEFTGTTDANGFVTVYGIPNGSTLATKIPWTRYGDVANYGTLPNERAVTVHSFPVRDTTRYPSFNLAKVKASTVGIHRSSLTYAAVIPFPWEAADRGADFGASWVRPDGGTFFGTSGGAVTPVKCGYSHAYFDGGESLNLPWTLTISHGGKTMTVSQVYVWEDFVYYLGEFKFDEAGTIQVGQEGQDLDYAQDAYGEPYLAVAQQQGIQLIEGRDMEASHVNAGLIATADGKRPYSPSRVLLCDHRHLMAAVVNGKVEGWYSDNGVDFTALAAPIADDATYVGCILRLDPDGDSVHGWLTAQGGTVKHVLSTDGGETWSLPALVGSLPTIRDQRIDARHDSTEWVAVLPLASGALQCYRSSDGETWVEDGEVAASGSFPWLILTSTQGYCCLYHDGESLVSRLGHYDGAHYTWGAAQTVAAGAPAFGAVGVDLRTKLLAAWRRDREDIAFALSRQMGETTWEEGSEG
jgi:hypothetical protein